jgi:hypothetical protein
LNNSLSSTILIIIEEGKIVQSQKLSLEADQESARAKIFLLSVIT